MSQVIRYSASIRLFGLKSTAARRLYSASSVNDYGSNYLGPSLEDVIRIRKKHLASNIFDAFRAPIIIHRGKMQWLYDHQGKKYLDMYGSVATCLIGHCNPILVEAMKAQMDKLWHATSLFSTPIMYEYVEKLTSKLPSHLQTIMFTNSGSEANDLAILLARVYTKNVEIIAMTNSYHGLTQSVMGLTSFARNKFRIAVPNSGIHHVMHPDPFAGLWGGKFCRDSRIQTNRDCNCDPNNCEASTMYFNQLENLFKYSIAHRGCAAMFFEPIQGYGGTVQFTKGYMKMAADLVHEHGGLLIADEIQTGLGRTGEHFWGHEGHGVKPDIMTLSKGIGNGFPFGVVATTREIADALKQAVFFSTFSGNALACAAGLAVLKIIDDENLQENAHNVGNYMMDRLGDLRDKYEIIGDVRGKGCMIGVELVEDKQTRKPLNCQIIDDIFENCKDNGVIFGKGGNSQNVIRIKPPMIITKSDVDMAIEILEKSVIKFCQ